MKKRILAMFLTLAMCLSLLPVSAFATGDGTDETNADSNPIVSEEKALLNPADLYYNFGGTKQTDSSDITLHKQAEKKETGRYTVNLSATATQNIQVKPTKVIFVLDASYSMSACTDSSCGHNETTGANCTTTGNNTNNQAMYHEQSRWTSATTAIKTMKEKLGTNGISYQHVAFGGNYFNESDPKAKVVDNYDTYSYELGSTQRTFLQAGVEKAIELAMSKNGNSYTFKDDSKYVMIIVSDGAATDGYNPTGLSAFKEKGGEVYAVGFTFSNDSYKGIVSNAEPGTDKYEADVKKYYFDASDAGELGIAMDTITENIRGLITDPMGTGVTVDGDVNVTNGKPDAEVNTAKNQITWTDPNGLNGTVALTYDVTIDADAYTAGSHTVPLNNKAKLNYSVTNSGVSESHSIDFPDPKAMIEVATLDVEYVFGEQTIEARDQEHILLPGSFTYVVPSVGDKYGDEYFVSDVTITKGSESAANINNPEAKAYKVVVTLTKAPVTATYTVKHYQQNLNNDEYTIVNDDTQTLSGNIGAQTEASAKQYTGFTAKPFSQETITADGNTVVKIYYDRNSYKVTYKYTDSVPEGATPVPTEATYKYGETVTVAADATALGYTFTGWTSTEPEVAADATSFTMPAKAVELTGSFEKDDSQTKFLSYTVKFYKDSVQVQGDTITQLEKVWVGVDTLKVAQDVVLNANKYEGYVLDEERTGDIPDNVKDGTVLHIYYDKDTWNDKTDKTDEGDGIADKYQVVLKYVVNDDMAGSVSPTQEVITLKKDDKFVQFGEVTVASTAAESSDKYAFEKWTYGEEVKGTNKALELKEFAVAGGNVYTFTANFKVPAATFEPSGAKYIVEHYKADAETGAYPAEPTDKEILDGEIGHTVTGTAKTYEGYCLNEQVSTMTGTLVKIESNADIVVLKLYYDADTWNDDKDKINEGDGIPDKYQKLVTYKVIHGNWNDNTDENVVAVVTLKDVSGANSETGSYTLTAADVPAVGQKPDAGYKAGSWDTVPVGQNAAEKNEFTYTYARRSPSNNDTDIPDNPPALNTEDHFAYIVGYPDGNVKPAGNITRAEVATIFFRLLTDEARDLFWSTENEYTDVNADQWFNNAISTLSNADIINGYPDGTFRPNATITRAEFAKIAASFFESIAYTVENPFVDVSEDDWFFEYVMTAYETGLITGYPEGDFRPNAYITRAEACTIVNRTIDRNPHEDQLHEDMIPWPDNPAPSQEGHAWYYEQIQEATNSHNYEMKNEYENWTEILPNRDWVALEQAWADSNDAPGGSVMK